MASLNIRALAAGLLLAFAVPALAQVSFSDGYTFLKAVRERDGATAERILSNPSSNAINIRDQRSGEGALHILARERELGWLGFMLNRGARPDLQDNEGNTPMVLAAQIGWREGVERLLIARADPNLANRRGETALIYAVRRNDVPLVRLLVANRANPNQTDYVTGSSALDYARQDPRRQAVLRELENAGQPQRPAQVQGPALPGQ